MLASHLEQVVLRAFWCHVRHHMDSPQFDVETDASWPLDFQDHPTASNDVVLVRLVLSQNQPSR